MYDENITGASTFELHNITALTFGEEQCLQVFKIIREGMNVNEATPLTIEKSLKLVTHLLTHGAERCVDAAWDLMDVVEPLEEYNTALVRGAIHNLIGGGVDRGGNVRRKESEREKSQSQADILGGIGAAGKSTVIGAQHSLSDMLAHAASKPEKYHDDKAKMSGSSERPQRGGLDSDYTRQKQAEDLLSLDFETQQGGVELPRADDFAAMQREEELKKALEEKDEMMRRMMGQHMMMQQQQQQQQQQQRQQQMLFQQQQMTMQVSNVADKPNVTC
ncbi:hypothetical protein TrRE_jg3975 [Triparma retinervis]|uniref:ENTH domain-containing protein n=1 Tax=Triparma retinervis TaxID=2557542 RepID=A0A9W6ZEB2_9STRA|nr:hypothetical protein TrRE_jg3975 [Triparma retinervis]